METLKLFLRNSWTLTGLELKAELCNQEEEQNQGQEQSQGHVDHLPQLGKMVSSNTLAGAEGI